jgi:hypothetical protein
MLDIWGVLRGYCTDLWREYPQKVAKLIAPLTTKAVRSLQIGEVKRDGRGLIFMRLKCGEIAARLRYKRPITRKENVITLARLLRRLI